MLANHKASDDASRHAFSLQRDTLRVNEQAGHRHSLGSSEQNVLARINASALLPHQRRVDGLRETRASTARYDSR